MKSDKPKEAGGDGHHDGERKGGNERPALPKDDRNTVGSDTMNRGTTLGDHGSNPGIGGGGRGGGNAALFPGARAKEIPLEEHGQRQTKSDVEVKQNKGTEQLARRRIG